MRLYKHDYLLHDCKRAVLTPTFDITIVNVLDGNLSRSTHRGS